MISPTGPDKNEELSWTAFQYLLGELSPEDEGRFEARLADDQDAREALEQAVALQEAIRQAAPQSLQVRRARFAVRRVAIWVTGMAAVLVLGIGLFWSVQRGQHVNEPGDGAERNGPASADMARAWVEVRDRDEVESVAADPSATLPGEDLGMDEDLTGAEVRIPPWMLLAFTDQAEPEGRR